MSEKSTKLKKADLRRLSSLRQRRPLHFFRAAVVGFVAAMVAIGFEYMLNLVESISTSVSQLAHTVPFFGPVILVSFTILIGTVAGYSTARFAPEASGSGIPHVKAVLLFLRTFRPLKLLPTKFFAGALAIGCGFSLGREGPTVQLGAAVGALMSKVLKVPRRAHTHLIACGAGAGLAAAFNAPLAGFIFVIEELRREMSPITYGTALIATVVADGVTRSVVGSLPSFAIRGFAVPPISLLPIVVLTGVGSGLAGVLFNKTLRLSLEKGICRVSTWKKAAFAGLFVGICAWWCPVLIGPGTRLLEYFRSDPSFGEVTAGVLALLFVGKFLLTVICYGSGVPGGIFAPILAQGAMLGLFVGTALQHFFPEQNFYPSALGVIAMAAYFSGIVRAPLTGVVLIAEITGDYELLFLSLVACLLAYMVAEYFREKPIYEMLMELTLMERDGAKEKDSEPVIVDVIIEPGSKLDGSRIRQIHFPKGSLLVTIRRSGKEMVPRADLVLQAGDELAVLVSGEIAEQAFKIREAAQA